MGIYRPVGGMHSWKNNLLRKPNGIFLYFNTYPAFPWNENIWHDVGIILLEFQGKPQGYDLFSS